MAVDPMAGADPFLEAPGEGAGAVEPVVEQQARGARRRGFVRAVAIQDDVAFARQALGPLPDALQLDRYGARNASRVEIEGGGRAHIDDDDLLAGIEQTGEIANADARNALVAQRGA